MSCWVERQGPVKELYRKSRAKSSNDNSAVIKWEHCGEGTAVLVKAIYKFAAMEMALSGCKTQLIGR